MTGVAAANEREVASMEDGFIAREPDGKMELVCMEAGDSGAWLSGDVCERTGQQNLP